MQWHKKNPYPCWESNPIHPTHNVITAPNELWAMLIFELLFQSLFYSHYLLFSPPMIVAQLVKKSLSSSLPPSLLLFA
jgi:hypothetical protein